MTYPVACDGPKLSAAAYLVLSLVAEAGEATPYDLKVAVRAGAGHAWPLSHTQVYETCRALSTHGLLDERLEHHGRRRRFYSLTSDGRAALTRWRSDPVADDVAIYDPGLLQLYCGVPLRDLAPVRLAVHRQRLEDVHAQQGRLAPASGSRLALTLRAAAEREQSWIEFWEATALDS
jgi:PadR family transcriptional regulator, regulatory protein AphA